MGCNCKNKTVKKQPTNKNRTKTVSVSKITPTVSSNSEDDKNPLFGFLNPFNR